MLVLVDQAIGWNTCEVWGETRDFEVFTFHVSQSCSPMLNHHVRCSVGHDLIGDEGLVHLDQGQQYFMEMERAKVPLPIWVAGTAQEQDREQKQVLREEQNAPSGLSSFTTAHHHHHHITIGINIHIGTATQYHRDLNFGRAAWIQI